MISLQKIGDSAVKFVFTDSDHYLYGNGEIEVPVNSLLLVIDESDMVTFKKLSGDPFLSFRADNSNLGTKAAIEQFYKDNMVGSTGGGSGSGVTPSEVQEMIDESISGKADTSDVTAVANDVSTLSGQVATKVATSDFNAYSAATDSRLAEDEEVTAAALNDLDAALNDLNDTKQDNLEYYSEDFREVHITVEDTDNNVTGETSLYSDGFDIAVTQDVDATTQSIGYINGGNVGVSMGYDLLTGSDETDAHSYFNVDDNGISADVYADEETTTFEITSTGVTINGENVLTDGIITTAVTSGSTDDEIPTAKATYDAIQAGGGGGATYSAGQGISIDTANTISFAVPIYSGATGNLFNPTYNNNSILIGQTNNRASIVSVAGGNACTGQSYSFTYGAINNATGSTSVAIGNRLNAINDREAAFGSYNVSNKANTTFGDSGNTLFSVGNSTGTRHNAIELRQNGDLYFADTDNTTYSNYYEKPMVRLQDMYGALGGLKFVQCTQAEYSAMEQAGTLDANTLYIVSNVVS